MNEDERIAIHSLVDELENAFWITGKIKEQHTELKEMAEYQRIIKAIEVLEREHDVLYKKLKDD